LVICYGNIYRSAFLAEYLRAHVGMHAEIRSAGFHPVAGRSSPERHKQMCRDFGVDLAQHRSSILGRADLDWADMVVIMDRKNWVQVRRMGAEEKKLIWLGSLVSTGRVEIQDPYMMDDTQARNLLSRLHDCAKALVGMIQGEHLVCDPATKLAPTNATPPRARDMDQRDPKPRSAGRDSRGA
jgi:protein-tyrosine-phosphatase